MLDHRLSPELKIKLYSVYSVSFLTVMLKLHHFGKNYKGVVFLYMLFTYILLRLLISLVLKSIFFLVLNLINDTKKEHFLDVAGTLILFITHSKRLSNVNKK